jgi:hypothetical protein
MAISRATVATVKIKANRGLHSTPRSQASILFALQALSNSRETQHLNNISRLNRVEHSPSLKLIETSEVDPYAPAPQIVSKRIEASGELRAVETRRREGTATFPPGRALALGQSLLHSHAQAIRRSEAALCRARQRLLRRSQISLEREAAWALERDSYKAELRSAGALIVVAVGIATAAITWRLGVEKAGARASSNAGAQPSISTLDAAPIVQSIPPISSSIAIATMSQPTTQVPAVKSEAERGTAVKTWRGLLWKRD